MKNIIRFSIIAAAIVLVFNPDYTVSSNAVIEVDCSTYANEVFCLTNDARNKIGKRSLVYSYELEKVSMAKSKDMCKRNYFAHDYNGNKWSRFINQSGINYSKAGENLAKGYNNPQEALHALINSPTHYENIIGDYTHIGVYTESCGGINYTTQTFAKL